MDALPPSFLETRRSLHALACYAMAPARKARTGRIGLRPTGHGFGTPPFDDGSRILVRGDQLIHEPGASIPITNLPAAAAFLGIELSADPGVGHDLPPYAPHAELIVDVGASLALGAWYQFGQEVFDALGGEHIPGSLTEPQLWPEHFDLGIQAELPGGQRISIGFSPGDQFSHEPYAYVGPHDTGGLQGDYWNAPFGASVAYETLRERADPVAAALEFVEEGLDRVSSRL